jgi:hypothetical protein
VARVVAFIPDLLFGSQVQGSLRAAGHEVELVGDEAGVRRAVSGADAFVVDLTAEPVRRVSLMRTLVEEGSLSAVGTLAFYSHVDVDTRQMAESVGFDLIVPRSRMAREGDELIKRLTVRG